MATSSMAMATDYGVLAERMRSAGLLERQQARGVLRMASIGIALSAGWSALFVVGDSWSALGVAAFLAFVFTQVGFVAHEAGHHQTFRSRRANRIVGLVAGNALTGLSFGWWVPKHNAHHAHPNVAGRDPDIGPGAVALSFTTDVAGSRRGVGRLLVRYQAWLFFPLLMIEGAGLHISGVDHILRKRDRSAAVEGLLLGLHAAFYLTAVFVVLSPVRAVAFIAVQQTLFGLYLGCSFAPNHKGMPVLESESDMGFLDRQIITARNVAGGGFITFLLGGLNYQIEHHLFPAMARSSLPRARAIVRAFCDERAIHYEEDSLIGSYRQALRYLNLIGSAAVA